jgi:hypothetical protein
VVEAAYKLHPTLGPGLLEGVYEAFLCHELKLWGLWVEKQVFLPLTYEGMTRVIDQFQYSFNLKTLWFCVGFKDFTHLKNFQHKATKKAEKERL